MPTKQATNTKPPLVALLANNVIHFRRLPSFIRQVRHSLTFVLNDEYAWDEYARQWERSAESPNNTILGAEWVNQEEFLSILNTYSNPQSDALEIGCGGGRITSSAVKLFRHVHATDISTEMLRLAAKAVPDANVTFRKTDGFTLESFKDSTMDVVYSHDTFVHFSDMQVYPYLMEIRRVLRPGGVGILTFRDFAVDFPLFKTFSLRYWSQRTFPPMTRIYYTSEEALRIMATDLNLSLSAANNRYYLVAVFTKPVE